MTENEKPTLLTVDDEPVNLRLVVDGLSDQFRFLVATDGAKALRLAKEKKPELILLDVMMPEMDGFEVCAKLKEDPETRDIPVVFATALTQDSNEKKGLELGAVDYVTKPFRLPILEARLKNHVQMTRAKARMKELNEERKELLHVLCHDLMNPLGAIRLVAMGLDDDELDPEDLREIHDTILKSANHGLEIIELVRELRSIEEGKRSIRLDSVNLADCVRESVSMVDGLLRDKDIRADVRTNETNVLAEKVSLINSVLNNILTNAIKFSPKSSSLEIRSESGDGQVLLKIVDHGVGIPDDLLNSLFDMTKSTTRVGTAGEKGTGFGMPLVRRFMNSYGGEIEVSSSTGNPSGTVITLLFQEA